MNEDKIKSIVLRYKKISAIWLMLFLACAILVNWFFIQSNNEHRFESGFEYTSGEQGYIWLAVICGLNVVLHLLFYSLEKILLHIHLENRASE